MNRPRNPSYFPKMKVRGKRRRRLAPFQRVERAFRRTSESAGESSAAFLKLNELIARHEEENKND